MDKLIKGGPRPIDNEVFKMLMTQDKDSSLIESFLQILRRSKKLKEIIENLDFSDYLSENYTPGKKQLEGSLGLFNMIFSSYTKENEFSAKEFAGLIKNVREAHPEIAKLDDIEIWIQIVSSSFRFMISEMETTSKKARNFLDVTKSILNCNPDLYNKSLLLQDVIDNLFEDYCKAFPTTTKPSNNLAKLAVLQSNVDQVLGLLKSPETFPKLYSEMNIFSTQFNYDDQQSRLFNEYVLSFEKYQLEHFGNNHLNPKVYNSIKIDFVKHYSQLRRYDLRNQVNFGYIDNNFEYASYTKNMMVNLNGIPAKSVTRRDDVEINNMANRIGYTHKLQISKIEELKNQDYEKLQLPEIKSYLLKIMDMDPNMDILNDYDVIAFYQAHHPNPKFNKANYYRFISVDSRITEIRVGNPDNQNLNLMFLSERRLCQPDALKVFYSNKFSKQTALSDNNPTMYVTKDNDEPLKAFMEHIIKVHHLSDNVKDKSEDQVLKFIEKKKLTFYLPSTVESPEEIQKWKNYKDQMDYKKDTPLSKIYERLVEITGMDLYMPNDQTSHMYLNCFIDMEGNEIFNNSSQFEKGVFEKFERKKADNIILQTNVSDILDYLIQNCCLDPTHPQSNTSVWSLLPKYPPRLFLPNYLVVNVYVIRKMLEISGELNFEFVLDRIKKTGDPISNQYRILGLICRKKKAKETDPTIYYPCVKLSEEAYNFKCKGFLGEKEVDADIYKIANEYVDFIIYERRTITF
jgi:hypothetical protein